MTSSPAENPVTAGPVPADPVPADPVPADPVPADPVPADPVPADPVAATIPARSVPSPEGNTAGHRACSRPSRILASPGLIPAAFTRTRTWPGPGAGWGTSTTFRTSIPPYSSNRTALGIATPFSPGAATAGRALPTTP